MVAPINTREAGMAVAAQRVKKRMVANLTEPQYSAVKEAMSREDDTSETEVLRELLKRYCEAVSVPWPDEDLPIEGKNWRRGEGGKFVKKG